jgi:hypothetical protein
MAEAPPAPLYAAPEGHLSQGDIFQCHLLGTYGGTALTILRQESGDRPDTKFSSTGGLKFVNAAEVQQRIPCQEIVSCQVEHLSHFVIVTQTCDVAGKDRDTFSTCLIAKIMTFCDFVNHATLPFKWQEGAGESKIRQIRVAEFLAANLGANEANTLKNTCQNEAEYPNALREVLKLWKPKANSNEQNFKAKLQSFLTDITNNKEGRTYYFPSNGEFSIPESFADLGALFNVEINDIEYVKGRRVATLANPYKEDFSHRIANRFSRVALPVAVKGGKF